MTRPSGPRSEVKFKGDNHRPGSKVIVRGQSSKLQVKVQGQPRLNFRVRGQGQSSDRSFALRSKFRNKVVSRSNVKTSSFKGQGHVKV